MPEKYADEPPRLVNFRFYPHVDGKVGCIPITRITAEHMPVTIDIHITALLDVPRSVCERVAIVEVSFLRAGDLLAVVAPLIQEDIVPAIADGQRKSFLGVEFFLENVQIESVGTFVARLFLDGNKLADTALSIKDE